MDGPIEPKLPDTYADLKVSPDASSAEIKSAFHRLALLHHPDKQAPSETVDAADFRRIREAHDLLRDPDQKERYDQVYTRTRAQWDAYKKEHAEYLKDPEAWRRNQRGGFEGFGGYDGYDGYDEWNLEEIILAGIFRRREEGYVAFSTDCKLLPNYFLQRVFSYNSIKFSKIIIGIIIFY
jgi:curved DNA-binding protein CbpA